MREINKIAEGLFEKIRDRFEDVSLGDENAHATQNPEEARFFNFDYIVDGQNYGNITLSIIDETSLKVYFSKNISSNLDSQQKQEWYSFLKELREFAKRNMLSFEPRDITRSTLKQRDIQQVSKADSTFDKDEVVSESRLYGTSRSSYENEGPVRIVIRHSDHINPEQRGSRSRKIRAIYLENSEGERLKLPHNNLRYARAMARHCAEGGNINDDFGQHITEIAEECGKLKPFRAAMSRRVFEDEETQRMVEAAFEYHGLLKDTLGKMTGRKGYQQCKEQFEATSTSYIPEEDFDVDSLRERFVKRTYNDRMNDALPIDYKAYNMKKTNKMAEAFEGWANNVAESWDGNYDELLELLGEELPVGVDAANATSALEGTTLSKNETYDDLVDELLALSEMDPDADARETILGWMQTEMPAEYQEFISSVDDEDLNESGTGDTPIESMSRNELLDYLNLDPLQSQNISNNELRAAAEEKSQDMTESEYGSYGEINESDDQVESIQRAIIGRILNDVKRHGKLIRKAGPDGIMDAARNVAEWHAPVEELGSSDVSAMVREVYSDLGVPFPQLSENYGSASPADSASPLTHAHEHYCDACDSTECHCDDLNEGRMKDVAIDIEELSNKAFKAKYGKTKEEMKAQLAESTQLNEYLLRGGMPITDVLELNVFGDTEPEDPVSAYEEEFANSPAWMAVEQRYGQMAQALKKKILAQGNRKLTNAEANALESTWYDGSDAYSDVEEAVESLPEIYDAQLDMVDALLAGNISDEEFGDDFFEAQGQDFVNRDEKMKRMGAKPLGMMDKLKNIPRGMKAMAKGDTEDDLAMYNKSKATLEDIKRLAGLK